MQAEEFVGITVVISVFVGTDVYLREPLALYQTLVCEHTHNQLCYILAINSLLPFAFVIVSM